MRETDFILDEPVDFFFFLKRMLNPFQVIHPAKEVHVIFLTDMLPAGFNPAI